MAHDFKEKLAQGLAAERAIADYLGRAGLDISIALHKGDAVEERANGDYVLTIGSVEYGVEMKYDVTAARTGNIFVETISVDRSGKPGWALTCGAALLLYYIPPGPKSVGVMLVFSPAKLREALPQICLYRSVPARNKGYSGWGHIVPGKDFIELVNASKLELVLDI